MEGGRGDGETGLVRVMMMDGGLREGDRTIAMGLDQREALSGTCV